MGSLAWHDDVSDLYADIGAPFDACGPDAEVERLKLVLGPMLVALMSVSWYLACSDCNGLRLYLKLKSGSHKDRLLSADSLEVTKWRLFLLALVSIFPRAAFKTKEAASSNSFNNNDLKV